MGDILIKFLRTGSAVGSFRRLAASGRPRTLQCISRGPSVCQWAKCVFPSREALREDGTRLYGSARTINVSNDKVTAVERARRIHEHASSLGFDWTDTRDVIAKVREEIDELREAYDEGNLESARNEFGDLLFSMINLSRFIAADSDLELMQACDRFEARFMRVQAEVKRRGHRIRDYTLDELDVIWEEVKRGLSAHRKTS